MSQGIVREQVIGALAGALQQAKLKGQLKIDVMPALILDSPKRAEWGDLASTVAMNLASAERRPPREVAEIIVSNLERRNELFDRIDIMSPGFLNLTIKRNLWLKVLDEIEEKGRTYGSGRTGVRQRILVEYVSANPTGPLHVGHGRGAAVGQAIASLLRANGHEVVEEYYINDAGRQMKLLGTSVFARYASLCGAHVEFPEDGYKGIYVEEVAKHLKECLGTDLLSLSREQAEARSQEVAYRELLTVIEGDLKKFGVEFNSWFSEASLLSSGAVEQALADLQTRGLLFEEDGAMWFRSSAFGDEKDRVVRKREGDYTYLASDIAYHRDKLSRGYDLLIDVWGADHHGYIPRMEAVVQAYGYPKERLRVVLVQMVKLLRGGRMVEMSKRSGEFITMSEVMDEVGVDAAKFFFLMRRSDSHLDFDLDLAKQRSAENPVYYVQYAHARISSLFRVAAERGIKVPEHTSTDLSVLQHPDEFSLIRKLSMFPSVVSGAALALEPHRVTFYLQELAGLLHTFYFRHRILPPACDSDLTDAKEFGPADVSKQDPKAIEVVKPEITAGRLVLMGKVQTVLRNGLELLGLSAPERM